MMKLCPSFPGYSATDDGRVISHRCRGTGKQMGSISNIDLEYLYELAKFTTKKGYQNVSITMPTGKARPVGVHRLVSDAFHGPCPIGMQVRHLDGIPGHNSPENLAHGTALENADDRRRHGTYLGGSNHKNAKLTGGQAASIRTRRRGGEKVKDLAKAFGVSVPTIESIIYNKSYLAPGIEFKRVMP